MADQQLVLGPWQSIFDNLKINGTEEPREDDSIEQVVQALVVLVRQVMNNHRQERREEYEGMRQLLQAQGNTTSETIGQFLQAQVNTTGETIGQFLHAQSQLVQAQGNATWETIGQILHAQSQLVQAQSQLLHAVINNNTEQRRQELEVLAIFLLIGAVTFLVLRKFIKQSHYSLSNTNTST